MLKRISINVSFTQSESTKLPFLYPFQVTQTKVTEFPECFSFAFVARDCVAGVVEAGKPRVNGVLVQILPYCLDKESII